MRSISDRLDIICSFSEASEGAGKKNNEVKEKKILSAEDNERPTHTTRAQHASAMTYINGTEYFGL
jgi:hypothetical protein